MHICFVCSEYPPAPHGGIGSFTQTLARELVRHGHTCSVLGLYPDMEGVTDDQGVQVIRVRATLDGPAPLRLWRNRHNYAQALTELQARSPIDILEGGELDIGLLPTRTAGRKLLRMHGGPHFFSTGPKPSLLPSWKEKRSFRIADHLCAVSHYVGEQTRQLLKLGTRPIEVIRNPVDIETFRPTPPEQEIEGRIVFAGTITERKGIRQLIAAMPAILAAVPHAELHVYGGESIGYTGTPFADTLRASMPPAVARQVLWLGRVSRSELPGVISQASVCIYPSHMEALPIAWLEGLACGKAVVASATGPGPEVMTDGLHGLLCNPHEPATIASALIRVLQDPALRRKLGAAARRHVEENYALPGLVQRNIDYYQSLVTAP